MESKAQILIESIRNVSVELNKNGALASDKKFFPINNWHLIADTGLFRSIVPKKYGGSNLSMLEITRVLEVLGRECEDPGLNFSVATQLASSLVPLSLWGTDAQREKYLAGLMAGKIIGGHAISERGAGSDVLSMETLVEHSENGEYLLKGEKSFVTNGPVADIILVYARTSTDKAINSLSTFIIEMNKSNLKRGDDIPKFGLHSSPNGFIEFKNTVLPHSSRIGNEGEGFFILDRVMKKEIIFSFAITLAEAGRTLDGAINWSKKRKQFGRSISSNQALAHKLVNLKIRYEAARALLHAAANKMDKNLNATIEISSSKILISDLAIDISLANLNVLGGRGYLNESGAGQKIADTVSSTIYSGTNDLHRNRIAASLGL